MDKECHPACNDGYLMTCKTWNQSCDDSKFGARTGVNIKKSPDLFMELTIKM